ncbi:DUF4139 domain-containing protein [bacterium]|nr:MAG: DUF4139 domain-containing protein [bacterium]
MKKSGQIIVVVFAALSLFVPVHSWGKVDLVTLPARDKVQITIYNSADLTLARDIRSLTTRKGSNRLQYSWAGTLIDPTSLEMFPLSEARKIDVQSLVYPPRVTGLGIWNMESEVSGKVPFEITYFTSGISWKAYYLATLAPDESSMRIQGYVRVNNNSGEDYQNAETRLIVGKINLLDRIAELARRRHPYGRPGPQPLPGPEYDMEVSFAKPAEEMRAAKAMMAPSVQPKQIRKEGLSEYFLYSIEGTEDIENGWGKRLISFTAGEVPVKNLYRYEEEKYGKSPMRFLSFANDEKHKMGREPIPGGLVKVFRSVGRDDGLSYVGAQTTKYVPKGEEVNLNLGASDQVSVKPTLMDYSTDNFEWKDDRITGWDEHRTVKVELANYRDIPVKMEVRRNFPVTSWEISNEEDPGNFKKVDRDTVQYTIELPPHGRSKFTYNVVLHHGSRER